MRKGDNPSIRLDIADAERAWGIGRTEKSRAEMGQFFTPPEIADIAASLFSPAEKPASLLDLGAGTGILSAYAAAHVPVGDICAVELDQTPVVLPDEDVMFISNEGQGPLVRAIVEKMLPRFAGGVSVLAIDTADGLKFPWEGKTGNQAAESVRELISEQPKTAVNAPIYPDVIAYDEDKGWLFLVEACNSEGVFDERRRSRLADLLGPRFPNMIFITCFNSRNEMKQWLPQLAWETEVWVADDPDHMIHLDGAKYLSPYIEN